MYHLFSSQLTDSLLKHITVCLGVVGHNPILSIINLDNSQFVFVRILIYFGTLGCVFVPFL